MCILNQILLGWSYHSRWTGRDIRVQHSWEGWEMHTTFLSGGKWPTERARRRWKNDIKRDLFMRNAWLKWRFIYSTCAQGSLCSHCSIFFQAYLSLACERPPGLNDSKEFVTFWHHRLQREKKNIPDIKLPRMFKSSQNELLIVLARSICRLSFRKYLMNRL
jgi:hypothetical protein